MTVAMAFCMLFAFGTFSASADEIGTPVAPETTNYTFTISDKVEAKLLYGDMAVEGVDNAIRFTSTIAKNAIDENVENFNVKVKTIIAKTESLEALEGEKFTKANLDAYNEGKEEAEQIKYQQVIFDENTISTDEDIDGGDNYIFRACLYNVKAENFTEGLSAVSYLEINGVATQYTETVATSGLWEVANAHKTVLLSNYEGGEDEILVSADKDEYNFVSSLCKTHNVTISNGTETVYTQKVKHGEKLSSYIGDVQFSDGVAQVKNFSYPTAFVDSEGRDCSNDVITSDTPLTAVYGDEGKIKVDGTVVTGAGSKFFNYTTEVVIPDTLGVTEVSSSAFLRNSKVTKIVLPESVTVVGDSAFFECTALETLIMPGVLKVVNATGDYHATDNNFSSNVCFNCDNLKVVVINSNLAIARKMFVSDNATSVVDLYVYGSSFTGTDAGTNGLLTGTKYYYSEKDCMGTWKYVNGEVVKSTVTAHAYVDGACANCGVVQTEGITYTYVDYSSTVDGFKGYVVSGYTGSATELYVRATYNGTNGQAPVIAVAPNSLGKSNITKVVLPDSVKYIGDFAFWGASALETIIMPGVTDIYKLSSDVPVISDPKGDTSADFNGAVFGSSVLTVAVVNSNLKMNRKTFVNSTNLDLYIDGSENNIVVRSDANNGNKLSGKVYYYSEKDCMGTWKYVNGEVVKSTVTAHAYVDGACANCGVVQTEGITYTYVDYSATVEGFKGYVVSGYTGSATELYVRATYNGTNGHAPVIAVAPNAFANNSKITKVVLPISVQYIGASAFSQTTALETIIMPGVLGFYNVINGQIKISDPTGVAGADKDDLGLNVFLRNNNLTVAVVNENLKLDRATFVADAADYVAKLDLYVYGSSSSGIIQRTDNKNNMLTKVYYYYSETQAAGCWYYNNGVPTLYNVQ